MHSSLQQIQNASAGLLYISEGDYPFEAVAFDNEYLDLVEKLLELSGKEKGTKVDVVSLEHFLRNMTTLTPNASLEQQQNVQQFLTLQQVLKEELTDISVYLVGEVEMDAFILGRSGDGTYIGLRTKVIRS